LLTYLNNDYYTGAPDLRDSGGHTGPVPGFSPNTRTIMQIKVADTAPAPAFDERPTARSRFVARRVVLSPHFRMKVHVLLFFRIPLAKLILIDVGGCSTVFIDP
jgi:hypothetical protein